MIVLVKHKCVGQFTFIEFEYQKINVSLIFKTERAFFVSV